MANITVSNPFLGAGPVVNEPDAGTLLVTAAGQAISTDSDAVILGDNWIVNILGGIGTYGANKFGLVIGTPDLAALSSVSIGTNAEVFAAGTGGGAIFTFSRTNIVNKGSISGNEGIREASTATGNYKITNNGAITAQTIAIALDGEGTHTIVNTGTILGSTAAIQGQTSTFVGVEHVTNSGTITGFIDLGLGDDVFTNFAKVKGKIKDGHVNAVIQLGDGNDKFFGGKFLESVGDNAGTDTYKLGGGNDFFGAVATASGNDIVDGGSGKDTYALFGATGFIVTNIDSVAHAGRAANTAFGAEIGTDTVVNFENVIGSSSTDEIYGSSGANELFGREAPDFIFGFGGNDMIEGNEGNDDLFGGTGNDLLEGGADDDNVIGEAGDDELRGGSGIDTLIGGLGKDEMSGGSGADSFRFDNLNESGVGAAKRDVIFDFSQTEGDKIFLSFIDADTTTAGDQAFDLTDNQSGLGPFQHVAGQLHFKYVLGKTIVEGDVNGDAKADFQIELAGHFALTDADFNL